MSSFSSSVQTPRREKIKEKNREGERVVCRLSVILLRLCVIVGGFHLLSAEQYRYIVPIRISPEYRFNMRLCQDEMSFQIEYFAKLSKTIIK